MKETRIFSQQTKPSHMLRFLMSLLKLRLPFYEACDAVLKKFMIIFVPLSFRCVPNLSVLWNLHIKKRFFWGWGRGVWSLSSSWHVVCKGKTVRQAESHVISISCSLVSRRSVLMSRTFVGKHLICNLPITFSLH